MGKWDKDIHLFRHEPTKYQKYQLVDTDQPCLLEEIFPYDQVPRIEFDNKIIPIQPAKSMYITDTTFRDGQQARPPFQVKQVVDIFDLLHRLGGPNGVIRQSEFFLYSERDRQAVGQCLEKGYHYPEITGWIRANENDLGLVKEIGLSETGILTSVSDYHIFLKLHLTRKQALEKYLSIARAALDKGITPRCHFEDVTRADIYGFVIPFAIELMKLSEEAKRPVKIRLCDTLGYGITFPSAALPRSVPKLVRAMIDDAGVPGKYLEWHGHNDFHKVHINAASAWLYGCYYANGTILSFGERTGNPSIEGLIIEYIGLRGDNHGIDTRVITEIATYAEKELDVHIPSNYPFVGSDFNSTSAGIHVDGLLKDEKIYNAFDTTKLLNRPPRVQITDKSGLAGITFWINAELKMRGINEQVDKLHPGVTKLHQAIMRQYEKGRITSFSRKEMEELARRYLPHYFISEYDKVKQRAYDMAAHLIEKVIELPEIRSMNPPLQEPVLEELVTDNPFIQLTYICNLDGKKITKNITQIVDRAKYAHFGLNEDFSNREWFIKPLEDGKIHVTDIKTSFITGRLIVTVSGPIRDNEGTIMGILGIDIRFEDLAKLEEDED
ncbi:MAG: histone-lysine N-methyltransferase [Deltaproteobacteria bacterium]|nr:histone-lysine N-methyltransferase [Deltaproteobacteria bacterium]